MSISTTDAKAAAAKARQELASALDGIEEKFHVQKRASELSTKAVSSYKENPVPWIVGAAAVGVAAVGLVAWAIFGGDD